MLSREVETRFGKFLCFDVSQQSPEWFRLRAGRPSASCFHKLITASTLKPANNDTMRHYMRTLLAELVMREPIEKVGSTFWIERGKELEPKAREEYAFLKGEVVTESGFWMDETKSYGASPDGLVGEDGLVEFKTGAPETIIGYALEHDALKDAHYPQLQGQLLCTGREWVDVMAHDPQIKPVVRRVYRDEVYIAALVDALDAFLERMNEACEQLIATGYLTIDTPEETPNYLMAG